MTTLSAPTHAVLCSKCEGTIARDGLEVHDHEASCSYWRLRCWSCRRPLDDRNGQPSHPQRPELCFMCGDALDAESHP